MLMLLAASLALMANAVAAQWCWTAAALGGPGMNVDKGNNGFTTNSMQTGQRIDTDNMHFYLGNKGAQVVRVYRIAGQWTIATNYFNTRASVTYIANSTLVFSVVDYDRASGYALHDINSLSFTGDIISSTETYFVPNNVDNITVDATVGLTTSVQIGGTENILLGGRLMIVIYTNYTTYVKTSTYATKNIKYVICIDASTCIAADDTTMLGYYLMKANNFLSGNQNLTHNAVNVAAVETVTGLSALPTMNMILIAQRTNFILVDLAYQNSKAVPADSMTHMVASQMVGDDFFIVARPSSGSEAIIYRVNIALNYWTRVASIPYAFSLPYVRNTVISTDADFIAMDYPMPNSSDLWIYEKKPCHTSCATCSGPNDNDCLTCLCGLDLLGTAPNGCQGLPCKDCSVDPYVSPANCTSCFYTASINPTFLLETSKKCTYCNSATNPGYYGDRLNGSCTPCPIHCSSCINSTACSTCDKGYYLDDNQMCVTCTSGSYFISGTICLRCSIGCSTCLGLFNNCTSCSTPSLYISATGMCALCNPANRSYIEGNYCKDCGDSCLSCINSSICTKCIVGYSVNSSSGTCVICPSSGYFMEGDSCKPCPTDCSICTSSTVCTTCSPGKYILPNSNICGSCAVGNGYYTSSPNCLACGTDCLSCSSKTGCQVCVSGKILLSNDQCGDCATTGGEFVSGSRCYPCTASCKTCAVTPTQCTSCHPNFGLSNSQCVACQDGKFIDSLGNCVACDSSCMTCSSSSSHCLSCNSSQSLYHNASGNSCVACNMLWQYVDSNNSCQACDANCRTCAGTASNCLSCSSGLHMSSAANSCVACNTPGLFVDSNSVCQACDAKCNTCAGNQVNCTSCMTGLYMNLTTNSCVNCTNGSIFVDANNICRECLQACASCQNATACMTCKNSSLLVSGLDGTCMECSIGFFTAQDSKCYPCSSRCASCVANSTKCTGCGSSTVFDPLFLTCVDDCGSGRFTGLANNTASCLACNESCSQCSGSATHCTACDTTKGLYLLQDNSICVHCTDPSRQVNGSLCVAKGATTLVEVQMNFSQNKIDGVDLATIVNFKSPSMTNTSQVAAILKSFPPNPVFIKAGTSDMESPKVKMELSFVGVRGYLTLILVEYLETDKYKLVFRSDVSTFVEFEDTVYEILPYNFTFDFDNPRSSKQQIVSAQSQGSTVGGLIQGFPATSPAGTDIVTALLSSDPTGILTKASQIIKLYNRAFYFRVNYGDRFGAFMESIEKFSSAKRASGNSYIKSVGSAGWRGRLSEKQVSGNFFEDFNWKIALYVSVWILRAAASLITWSQMRAPKGVLIAMYFLSKVKLIIFNMVLLDFGFYATHAAMHFNYFPSSQLAMLCLTLIVLDILEMVDIIQSDSAWVYYYKTRIDTQTVKQGAFEPSSGERDCKLRQADESSQSSKSKARGTTDTSTVSNIILDSSNNNGSTASPVAPPRMVIDYPKTYANINARVHLVEYMAMPMKETKEAFDLKAVRILLCAHTVKMFAYNVVIGATQYCSGLGVCSLLLFEVVKLCWTVSLGMKKVFKSWITFIVEVNQSLFSLAFLCVVTAIHPKMMSQKISSDTQNLGILIVVSSVGTEYFLLLITIVAQLVAVFRKRKQQSNSNDKKTHFSQKFVGFIVYGPEASEDLLDLKMADNYSSLNTPDNSSVSPIKSSPLHVQAGLVELGVASMESKIPRSGQLNAKKLKPKVNITKGSAFSKNVTNRVVAKQPVVDENAKLGKTIIGQLSKNQTLSISNIQPNPISIFKRKLRPQHLSDDNQVYPQSHNISHKITNKSISRQSAQNIRS